MSNKNIFIDEKILTENSDFLKAVVGAKTIEEAQCICAEHNIDLPNEVWNNVKATYENRENTDELSENELDDVSGGRFDGENFLSAVAGVVGIGAVIAGGSAAGVLVACAWVGYYAYKSFR